MKKRAPAKKSRSLTRSFGVWIGCAAVVSVGAGWWLDRAPATTRLRQAPLELHERSLQRGFEERVERAFADLAPVVTDATARSTVFSRAYSLALQLREEDEDLRASACRRLGVPSGTSLAVAATASGGVAWVWTLSR